MSHLADLNVVVFATDLFDQSWPSQGDPNFPPLGEDAAVYFCRKLGVLQVEVLENTPLMGEGGWHWTARIGRNVYCVFLHWAAIGRPETEFWVIQLDRKRGILNRVFAGDDASCDMSAMVAVHSQIIGGEPRFHDVQWLTAAQFAQVY